MPQEPPRLLIADADPQTRSLLALLLSADAYQVDAAPSLMHAGRHAVERADLILADGCYTTHAAFATAAPRILAAAGGTPVVLLSALSLEPDKARAHGFRDALPKPFDIDDLVACVRAALAHMAVA